MSNDRLRMRICLSLLLLEVMGIKAVYGKMLNVLLYNIVFMTKKLVCKYLHCNPC